MKIMRTLLVSLLLLLVLSTVAVCTSSKKPEDLFLTQWLVFDALNLPYSQSPGDYEGPKQNTHVLYIENWEGRLLAVANWDGSAPRVSAGGKELIFILSALLEGRHVEYELGINIESKSKFPGGSVVLTVKDLSGFKLGSSYTHFLRLHGFECLVSDDGRAAALSPVEAKINGLSSYIAMVAQMGTCLFRFKQAQDFEESCLITATSEAKEGKGFNDLFLMEILIASAQSWAPEHVLSYANAMVMEVSAPDIRVLGISDKASVTPGETLKYSYFLFNAGMGNAVDVELVISIPAEVELIPETLSGSKGELRLIQQGPGIQFSGTNEEGTDTSDEERTIRVMLTEEIIPGEVISIEFEVAV